MYDGEVFTFRSDPAPRTVAAGRAQRRSQRPEPLAEPRTEAPDPGERTVLRLERRIARLEESVAQLSDLVQHLQEAAAVRPEPAWQPREPLREEPKVTVQLQNVGSEQPVPPRDDVKVTLFGSGSTEAILGQVKVTQQY
jgi:hypothetical protein